MSVSKQVTEFRKLHESGCFVLPNPWDRGSAIMLQSLGFKALATSSSALGFVRGVIDSPVTVGLVPTLDNCAEIAGATDLPVTADFQNGFAGSPEEVGANVLRCVKTGVAGLSIEDATGDPAKPLFDMDEALERVKQARAAIDDSGSGVVLTARCEAFLVDHSQPLKTAIDRLVAFADAGADCLFAPGISTPDEVREVVAAVAPKPVNVLAHDTSWMTVQSLADLGVRRISVGSALARVAWGGFRQAAESIAKTGSFESLNDGESFESLNAMFTEHAK